MADGLGGWHREDIKAALRKAHGPITRLSLSWGYSRSAITHALARATYSTAVEERIARTLGRQPHALWPDRWHPNGSPRPRAEGGEGNSRSVAPHRLKGGVA